MLLLISPAKTLDETAATISSYSQAPLLKQSQELMKNLQKLDSPQLQKLMNISPKIADLNLERNQNFSIPFDMTNSKQAILMFKGDVYQGLGASDFDAGDLEFAQQHLAILSGLYGYLRPLDLMQPYRLEMGTSLKVKDTNNLYAFWKDLITNEINKTKQKVLVNLASNEYFKAVKQEELKAELWTVNFKENRNGKYKIIAFSAKKARGMMCRYVIKNRLEKPEDMKSFDLDNYSFNEALSSERELIFTR